MANAFDVELSHFWGRISSFDHRAVKCAIRKNPQLIFASWNTSTPISWLFCITRVPSNNKVPKMLRILLDSGAIVNRHVVTCFAKCPFTNFNNINNGEKCFRMLLNNKSFVEEINRFVSSRKHRNDHYGLFFIEKYQQQQRVLLLRQHLLDNSRLPIEIISVTCSYI